MCWFWYRRTSHRYFTTVPVCPHLGFTSIVYSSILIYTCLFCLFSVGMFPSDRPRTLCRKLLALYSSTSGYPRRKWWKRRLRTVFLLRSYRRTDAFKKKYLHYVHVNDLFRFIYYFCFRRTDQGFSAGNYGRRVRARRAAPVASGGQGA